MRKNDWQDVDYVLGCFAKRRRAAKKGYLDHVHQGIEMGMRPELVGGGLIRSLGGWAEVKDIRNADIRLKGDERILGDSDYVLGVLKETGLRFERRYELKARRYNLDALTHRVSEIFPVTPEKVFSPGKHRKRVQARSVLCYWAVRELVETVSNMVSLISNSDGHRFRMFDEGEWLLRSRPLFEEGSLLKRTCGGCFRGLKCIPFRALPQ